jgi:transcriptional regulator with XRE-family HTH domain
MGSVSLQSGLEVFVQARQKLGLTQQAMADAGGSSLRTVSRWEARESVPDSDHLHKLAQLLYPVDQDLARQAALAAGKTLEELGIVKPPQPPDLNPPLPAASSPPLPARLLANMSKACHAPVPT